MNTFLRTVSVTALVAAAAIAPAQAQDTDASGDTATTTAPLIPGTGDAAQNATDPTVPAETEGDTEVVQEGTAEPMATEGDTEVVQEGTAEPMETEGDTEVVQEGTAEPMETEGDTEIVQENTETPVITEGDAEMAEGEEAPTEVPGQIVLQDEDTVLARNLLGTDVLGSDGESIGDIDDLLIGLNGSVEGVVIGVGGFLGIGEKSVALNMDQLQVEADEYNNPLLRTNVTREQLEEAEEFVTARAQQLESEQDAAPAPMGTDPMAPAPAN